MKTINSQNEFNQHVKSLPSIYGDNKTISLECFKITCEISLNDNFNHFSIRGCIFEKGVNFSNIEFEENAEIINCEFESDFKLSNSKFSKKARFRESKFKGVCNFSNTTFSKLADFWATVFDQPVIFFKTDFFGNTVFSNATFKENLLFTYSVISSNLILRNANLEAGLDLSLSVFTGTLQCFNIGLTDYDAVNDIDDEKKYDDTVSKDGLIPRMNKIETLRILKHNQLGVNNTFDYLDYVALEQKEKRRQLWQNLKNRRNIGKSLEDGLILGLNTLSNNNGRSYAVGFLFTVAVTVLFFVCLLISTKRYSLGTSQEAIIDKTDFYRLYFEFLSPIHKVDFLGTEIMTSTSYVLDFFGRILFAFGVYQFIQAFRKFKR